MQRSRSWSDSRGRLTLVLHYPDCVETSLTWVPPRCNVEKSSSKGELSTWAMSRSMSKSKVENSSHSINVVECLQDYRLVSVLLEVLQKKAGLHGFGTTPTGRSPSSRKRSITILLPCGVLFRLLRNIHLEVGTCKPLNLPRSMDGRTDLLLVWRKREHFLAEPNYRHIKVHVSKADRRTTFLHLMIFFLEL